MFKKPTQISVDPAVHESAATRLKVRVGLGRALPVRFRKSKLDHIRQKRFLDRLVESALLQIDLDRVLDVNGNLAEVDFVGSQ